MGKVKIPIYIQGADPDAPAPDMAQATKPWDDNEKRHYVVQFTRALTPEESAQIKQDLRLRLDRYVPDLTYIEYLDKAAVAGLGGHDLVNELFPLLPIHKIAPDIGGMVFQSDGRKATSGRLLRAVFFPEVNLEEVEVKLRERGADKMRLLDDRRWHGVARAEFLVHDPGAIQRIAELEMVSWIEEIPEVVANAGIPADILESGVLNSHPILDDGLRGKNQVVAIIDKGRVNFDHCWFKDVKNGVNRPFGPDHRKVRANYDLKGGNGVHAAFVCGILAGDHFATPGAANPRGIACDAKFTYGNAHDFQADDNDLTLLQYLVKVALEGTDNPPLAHIVNTSWHSEGNKQYSQDAADVDTFTWHNEECLVVASAANSTDPVAGPPGTAKNSLCVGAAYVDTSTTPPRSTLGDGFAGPTGHGHDPGAQAADGRRKPDLLAPGCAIESADPQDASNCGIKFERQLGFTDAGAMGIKPASVTCGTSFATPVVSAAAAIVRQYFVEGRYPSGKRVSGSRRHPSAALIKAVLLNSTEKTTQSPDYPTDEEGWGLLRLDRILRLPAHFRKIRIWDFRNDKGLRHGESRGRSVVVNDNLAPLKVTLVWTDFPADANATRPAINNLDLIVTSPDGTETYLGNVFDQGFSITGGLPDERNNVEMVLVRQPMPGRWRMTVCATNVANSRTQGFALVARGNIS